MQMIFQGRARSSTLKEARIQRCVRDAGANAAVVTEAQSAIGRDVCQVSAGDGHAVVVNRIEDQSAADELVRHLT